MGDFILIYADYLLHAVKLSFKSEHELQTYLMTVKDVGLWLVSGKVR